MRPNRTPTTALCKACGKSFVAPPSRKRVYCSRACWRASNGGAGNPAWKGEPDRVCQHCGNTFHVKPSRVAKGAGKYCSKPCAHAGRMEARARACETCGTTFVPEIGNVAKGQGRFCSPACWYKHLSTIRGEDKWSWRGGERLQRRGDMNRTEYKEWRAAVYERDNYTCQGCGDNRGGNLNAHHIKSYRDHPELRLDVGNGVTLCEKCHKVAHRARK